MATNSPRRFTGRHAAIILVAFFGVVIAINLLMARMAISTFGGTVVDNSYVASQNFNDWLAQARVEQALGWQVDVARDGADHLAVTVRDGSGAPLPAAQLTALARHPLGRKPERIMRFGGTGEGRFHSTAALGAGRWQVVVTVESNGQTMRIARDIA